MEGLGEAILILHHHQPIAGGEFLLTTENAIADAHVVDVCPLVAARYNNSFVGAHMAIAGVQRLNEFIAGNPSHIGKHLDAQGNIER